MGWIQVMTIVGINIAVGIWMIRKLDSDVKAITSCVESSYRRLDAHALRIDQLYKMFVDLLKDAKK